MCAYIALGGNTSEPRRVIGRNMGAREMRLGGKTGDKTAVGVPWNAPNHWARRTASSGANVSAIDGERDLATLESEDRPVSVGRCC